MTITHLHISIRPAYSICKSLVISTYYVTSNGVLQIDQFHIFLATSVLSSQVTIPLFSEVLFSC